MFSAIFILLLFAPAAVIAGATFFILRSRPPVKRVRGFPVLPVDEMKIRIPNAEIRIKPE